MQAVDGRIPAHDIAPATARAALRIACRDLNDRGLYIAARWAAELLNSVPADAVNPFQTSTPTRSATQAAHIAANLTFSSPGGGADASFGFMPPASTSHAPSVAGTTNASPIDAEEVDQWSLGKAYFDAKELERAARALKECRGPRGRFLGLYARFLVRLASPLSFRTDFARTQSAEKKVQEEADVMMGACAL